MDVSAASTEMKSKRKQEPCSVSPLPYTIREHSVIPLPRLRDRIDAGTDSALDRFLHYGCSGAYSWFLACG